MNNTIVIVLAEKRIAIPSDAITYIAKHFPNINKVALVKAMRERFDIGLKEALDTTNLMLALAANELDCNRTAFSTEETAAAYCWTE